MTYNVGLGYLTQHSAIMIRPGDILLAFPCINAILSMHAPIASCMILALVPEVAAKQVCIISAGAKVTFWLFFISLRVPRSGSQASFIPTFVFRHSVAGGNASHRQYLPLFPGNFQENATLA